jgi:hypothetical protein
MGRVLSTAIVHRDIETAKPCDGLVDRVADFLAAANVGLDEDGFGTQAAQLGFESLALRFPAAETRRLAPSFVKARAVARPMPVSAPVIKTTGLFIALLLSRPDAVTRSIIGACPSTALLPCASP